MFLITYRTFPDQWIGLHADAKIKCGDHIFLTNLSSCIFRVLQALLTSVVVCDGAVNDRVVIDGGGG